MEDGPRFATVGAARVAYQTHGEGDLDIVYSPGLASHLDMTLQQHRYRRYIESLGRFGRVVRFDRRGTGISDPAPPAPVESWELWSEDLGAVLDDTGSEHAAIIATNDAGGAATLFAATYPERVRALVLFNTTSRFSAGPGYAEGHPPEVAQVVADAVRSTWGTDDSVGLLAPSLAADAGFRRWYTQFQRAASSPTAMADSMARVLRMDARHVLPEVRCPVLVIHRSEYAMVPVSQARYVVEHLPAATFLEVPGADAPIYTQGTKEIVDQIGAFLGRTPRPPADDRQFSTVLFTDIVSSTGRAAEVGDQVWHQLLDEHDAVTRSAVLAHDGRLIKSTGDGALVTFDAPSRAVRCADEIRTSVRGVGLDVRIGLHAGPVVVRQDGDVGGLAVHAAARVMSKAGPGEVWVSSGVAGLITDPDIELRDRGTHELKGLPEEQQLFSVAVAA